MSTLFRIGRVVRALPLTVVCLGCGSREPATDERVAQQKQTLTLPGVTFQTVLGGQFLGALNNGGSAVTATATTAQAWETFSLVDVNGGALESGDSVLIQAGNGQFFQALNGGGSSLNAGSKNQLGWETFQIVKPGGGVIANGDVVGLQASSGSWISAQNGGGGPVFAYGGALGSWEQLKIGGLQAAKMPPAMPPVTPPVVGPVTVPSVSFRTLSGNYLGAQNNGGGAVTASATAVQAWETFSLIDANGGTLESGDSVFIRAGSGQFFQALNGGGSALNAGSTNQLGWETFKIVKRGGGGTINSGDTVGLQASSGSWISAQNGGGGGVFAYGGALGSWEGLTFLTNAASNGGGNGGGGGGTAPPGWRLVWSDEFDGGGIDGSKWAFDIQGPGWVNHEWQAYTSRPENARVENGHLVIEGRSDWYQGNQYSSARIRSVGAGTWTYGRVEARIQLPGGWGTWPAFWMLPDDFSRGWPACGEIDIMEEVGYDQDSIHGTTHSGKYNWVAGTQRTATTGAPSATTSYHVYAVEWSPDRIDFFVDDHKYFTSPNDFTGDDAWPFNKNFHVILNLAIGGDWGAAQGVDPNIWPRQMLVDYVRVYEH